MKRGHKEKYEELQELDQHIKNIQQQTALLDAQLIELRKIVQSIEEVTEIKKPSEMFVPLGSGVFFKVTAKETREILVNVGANIMVKKDVEETRMLLQNQIQELSQLSSHLEQQVIHSITQARLISESLEKEENS